MKRRHWLYVILNSAGLLALIAVGVLEGLHRPGAPAAFALGLACFVLARGQLRGLPR